MPPTAKVRLVLISDTHSYAPNGGAFKLPPGDVLIHAGDLTNRGTYGELAKTIKWLREADFPAKIIVAGNHDVTLDEQFYQQHGEEFYGGVAEDAEQCRRLIKGEEVGENPVDVGSNARSSGVEQPELQTDGLVYLEHASITIKIKPGSWRAPSQRPSTNSAVSLKIFGSPYSPEAGSWAFGYPSSVAADLWAAIPLDSDIVITHTPAKYHLDERASRRSVGCEDLRRALWRVRPLVHVCGHVHEGRGGEIVRWDLTQENVKYMEEGVYRWNDPGAGPGNKKISRWDLTRSSGRGLENDGARGDKLTEKQAIKINTAMTPVTKGSDSDEPPAEVSRRCCPNCMDFYGLSAVPSGTLGQGGIPPSPRCDIEALSGRMGRRETCFVNCAIMAKSFPHGHGKSFNKPIVLDIDVPVDESE